MPDPPRKDRLEQVLEYCEQAEQDRDRYHRALLDIRLVLGTLGDPKHKMNLALKRADRALDIGG